MSQVPDDEHIIKMSRQTKIVLVTLGSRGDVFPFISLGVELQKRGADCYVCAGAGFEQDIKNYGLKSASLSVDFRPFLSADFIAATRTSSGLIRAWMKTRGFQGQFLDGLEATIKEIDPDLIIYHHNKGGARCLFGRGFERSSDSISFDSCLSADKKVPKSANWIWKGQPQPKKFGEQIDNIFDGSGIESQPQKMDEAIAKIDRRKIG